ncbi:endopeptidase La [Myxococcota bacterium]|nr:endopeptidase La [Myxococcota bacterium]
MTSEKTVSVAPVLPMRDMVLFPGMIAPILVERAPSLKVIGRSGGEGAEVLFATQKDPEIEEPGVEQLHGAATLGRVLRALRFPDGSFRVLVEGVARARVVEAVARRPFLRVRYQVVPEAVGDAAEVAALTEAVRDEFRRYFGTAPNLPPELETVIARLEDPARVADYVAGNLPLKPGEALELIAEADVAARLKRVLRLCARERSVAELHGDIHRQVQTAMDRNQREYYLKEQLRVIRGELGEIDSTASEVDEFRKRIEKARMPEEATREALREVERMARMHPEAAEYTVSRTYLDWLASMPWHKETRDRTDMARVEAILNEDHSGLEKVKERIFEYLAVRRLKPDMKGPILCFVGPPGVGKTSLGRSIARALKRKFARIALGGVKDESEIRGHRRTYIGALPGRIIQAIRRVGTRNPVIVLDELDKVGTDFRGDPASALLEALDPEQNNSFVDHYLDVPFDLSRVMFICTANVTETVPSALKDRLEVIELPGYIEEEKLEIARGHLVAKQIRENGLKRGQLRLADDAVQEIIRSYTMEAGVRDLERQIAAVCRKIARKVAKDEPFRKEVRGQDLVGLLGPRRFFPEIAERTDVPGVAVGLAWTPAGGEILFIEATRMEGGKSFRVTGQLGEVMKESAETALSYIRSKARDFGIDPEFFKNQDLHVHIPAGAIPKDGPSAGVTLTVALVSLLTGRLVRDDVAMTGEITLRGKVLPVGGIKEKVLAARRAGIRTVILPRQNEKDLLDIPEPLRVEMAYTFVETIDGVLDVAFRGGRPEASTVRAPETGAEPAPASA